MKITLHVIGCMLLVQIVLTGCDQTNNKTPHDDREVGLHNPSESGIPTSDPDATSLVKRGMVIALEPEKKLKGPEGDKQVIYRFYPFDNDQMRLRLTSASPTDGKNMAAEQEIDLKPYAERMIEVQGTSFTSNWVYNAKINGVVTPGADTQKVKSFTP